MNQTAQQRDLIVLVADADMEYATKSLLGRSESLGVAQIDFEVFRHHDRDPGCRTDAVNYLRQYIREFRYSLVLFDHHGCGDERRRDEIQRDVEAHLHRNGWKHGAKAIVIEPELEAWLWGDLQTASQCLGWGDNYRKLRDWLALQDLWSRGALKPRKPKEAMRMAMKNASPHNRLRHSPRIFQKVAKLAAFEVCQDPAFNEFKETLQSWFPPQP